MYILREAEVYRTLRSLSQPQFTRFLGTLTTTLIQYSNEHDHKKSDRLIHQPLRSSIVTKYNDTTLFMPSSDTQNTGMKIIALPAKGDSAGVNVLLSPLGQILGLVPASQVTAFRTALTAMCLFARVFHIPKQHIVVFGSGKQVEWHIRLALLVAPKEINTITVVNRGRQRLNEFEKSVLRGLQSVYKQVKFQLVAKEDTPEFEHAVQHHLSSADAIFCCTPSTAPLFPFSALALSPKRRFISLIGSYKPHMKEIDTDTLLSGAGQIFVDSKEACLEESGELIEARVNESQLIEIGKHLGSDKSLYPEGNVVLKCVGMGIMDLVVSRLLLEVARELGIADDVQGL